jgi:DNA-binding NarL/FixJ family response regulator
MPTVSASSPLRVLVGARQPLARAGLASLLGERADLSLAGQALSLEHAAQLVREQSPEVLLLDGDAWPAREISLFLEESGRPVVLVGQLPPQDELHALLRSGLRGFLPLESPPEDVRAALLAVSRGLVVLPPSALLAALPNVGNTSAELDEPLTEREREVLHLLALGWPNRLIANRLKISEHTVKFHVGSLLQKLGAASRTEAVSLAVRRGVLAL